MRYLHPDLQAIIESTNFALATCVKIVQRDGVTKYFTDWSENLTVDAQVYKSATGITWYSLENSSGFDTNKFAIEGLISNASTSTSEINLQIGFLSNALIEIFQVSPSLLTR